MASTVGWNLGMTVLVFGLPHDPVVNAVVNALERRGADEALWSPRDLLNDCDLEIERESVRGEVLLQDRILDLDDVSGIFNRQSNTELTPEFRYLEDGDPIAQHAMEASHRASRLIDLAPCLVMNRNTANSSNSSKPLQSLLIAEQFFVPRTCITNDFETAKAFCDRVGDVIFKSCSGERSIVTDLEPGQLEQKRDALAVCPVQFQEKIDGTDIRVHVVGDSVFASEIQSSSSDYRYDHAAVWRAIRVSVEIEAAAVALTRKMGMELSGIDLRLASDGRVYCFEVNPSPAFSVYEDATGQKISDEVASQLVG